MEAWLVGIDAGGTATRALACGRDSGALHRGEAAGANWTVHGPARCRERIEAAVAAALPEGATPAALCLCMAGYYPPEHEREVRAWLEARWPGVPARAEPDVLAAWAGAHGGEPGIVVVSGTGSVAYGRNAEGRAARAGGWGPLFSDEGSAWAVGIECLRALARRAEELASDGHSEPAGAEALARRFLERWPELGADLETWLRGVYRCGWGREEIAALAGEAAQLAEAGDPEAARILCEAAAALAHLALRVARALGPQASAAPGDRAPSPGGGWPLPVALQGGLAGASPLLRKETARRLAGAGLRLLPARHSPLEGALLLAVETWAAARGEPEAGATERRRLAHSLARIPGHRSRSGNG